MKKNTMEVLMEDVGNIRHKTDPLSTMRSLLALRTHLTSTRAILAAASGWDDTMDSVPSLLSSNPPDLVGAVEALVRLEAGARALRCVPGGRDERDVSLRKLRSQIEAMLRPRLLHALGSMDTRLGPLKQCVDMYGNLGRMEVLRDEYVRMRPAGIHALWFSFGGGGGSRKVASVQEDGNEEESNSRTMKDGEVADFDFNEDNDGDSTSPTINSGIAPTSQQTVKITKTTATAKQFIEFLPTFYDAVLELLAREKTQSRTVFGSDLSSSIVLRVLIECFRPILASFEKRLGSLCPAPGKGYSMIGSGDGLGGMEAIAAAFESTVRFLSLAYDRIEAWDGFSTKEEGKSNRGGGGGSGVAREHTTVKDELISTIRSAFLLIASPFVSYQRALAEAERDPLGEAATMVAKDVRGVVNFEDAAERFGYLAPFIFPLAKGEDDDEYCDLPFLVYWDPHMCNFLFLS